MPTLLRIDSSPLSPDRSFSRALTTEFVDSWQKAHPEGKTISRDLSTSTIPPMTAEIITAAYTPEDALEPEQKLLLRVSDELITELHNADEYVIGVPMHNFSVPANLKLWMDSVARIGKTFSYENGAPAGLLMSKKATVLVATGGVYDPGSPRSPMNLVEPTLRVFFDFLGVEDVQFVTAGGTARLLYGVEREVILRPALDTIRAQFQAA